MSITFDSEYHIHKPKNKLCRDFMNYLPFIATFYFMQVFLCYF